MKTQITAPSTTTCWLVADLGGTNIRFALASSAGDGRPDLKHPMSVRAREHASFAEAARSYLDRHAADVRGVVAAVAGRVSAGQASMTNLPWRLDENVLARQLGVGRACLVNDLGAAACALPALDADDAPLLWSVEEAVPRNAARRCVLVGPGTGLGIAGALIDGTQVRALDTEGGHAGYAPADAQEETMLRALRSRFGRVSWEHVACGPGLMNVLAALERGPGSLDHDSPESVLDAARSAADPRCETALSLFAAALAAVAGDAVLMQGAWDGVYLLGSLACAARPWLSVPAFRARFCDKGPFADAMARVPVHLLTHPEPVLLGSACIALAQAGNTDPPAASVETMTRPRARSCSIAAVETFTSTR